MHERIIRELHDRPLSVIRVTRGQEPFMQKNVPKHTPDWIATVQLWAEASKRTVSYALCNDRRTLLWFANQRAIEYHPTLGRADRLDRATHLVLDIDPPAEADFSSSVEAAQLVRRVLDDCGLDSAVKTSGAKGVHVFVPIDASVTPEDAAAATRAIAQRAEALDPDVDDDGVRESRPRRQGVHRLHPCRGSDHRRGLRPAGTTRGSRVVPDRLGPARRRPAGRLHRS